MVGPEPADLVWIINLLQHVPAQAVVIPLMSKEMPVKHEGHIITLKYAIR